MLIWDDGKPVGPSFQCIRYGLLLGAVAWLVLIGLYYVGGIIL